MRADFAALLRLAGPLVLIQVGTMLMGVVDTVMVGQLSPAALAAVALGNMYFFSISIFGLTSGLTPGLMALWCARFYPK